MDYQSQQIVLKNLFDMCKQKRVTVLMIAHRLETAATYCEKVLVLDQGSVLQFDDSKKVLATINADRNLEPENEGEASLN